ncbi:TylF/MycF/NovP-related O-methyltransferase [Sphingomonas baiyangensis]|uniref:Macrocin O-methyltransferase n=1 Tax=Sphingomonas baiyangensis TaxID=2572576 RepID=A0A4U1L8M9_9SPHN|nr:TylF/MycF/NovP-related O-methyltransferase [Sphingomonas baiyangensis]TKD53174.1 macrocin O-methyltransferase [Sphingomonas baiyangensis]
MPDPSAVALRTAYLDLLKRSITNYAYLGGEATFEDFRCVDHYDVDAGQWRIDPLSRPITLLRKGQLDLIEEAVLLMDELNVPGDFLEAGIWRGGAVLFMRALLEAYEIGGRRVFAADSFAGIPANTRATNDPVDRWSDRWVASEAEVRANIARFGLLDERVVFVPGFFEQSLPAMGQQRFALIRLDSDSYDSVETSLEYLYPLVSKGGLVIIDDWHLPGCRQAVEDYRARHGITDPIQEHDANAIWSKMHEYGAPARG